MGYSPHLRRLALVTGLVVLGSLLAGSRRRCADRRTGASPRDVARQPQRCTSGRARNPRSLPLISAKRPITGVRTVLPVLGRTKNWLHVELPGRPNGLTGWIRRKRNGSSYTTWHLVVEIGRRRVLAFHHRAPRESFYAVVGKPSTPTPLGTFFVEEAIRLNPGGIGAPFALA